MKILHKMIIISEKYKACLLDDYYAVPHYMDRKLHGWGEA
jgi:hypothetical protein